MERHGRLARPMAQVWLKTAMAVQKMDEPQKTEDSRPEVLFEPRQKGGCRMREALRHPPFLSLFNKTITDKIGKGHLQRKCPVMDSVAQPA